MLKHRGFPGRLPSSDLQFTIRRANPKGATPLVARERFRDRAPLDRTADLAFLQALVDHFGDQPFERGNLDAGRLGWLLGREVVALEPFDPRSYDQLLRVDLHRAGAAFPDLDLSGVELPGLNSAADSDDRSRGDQDRSARDRDGRNRGDRD